MEGAPLGKDDVTGHGESPRQAPLERSPGPSAMNGVWLWLIVVSILVGAANGKLEEVGRASFQGARSAVELAIGLVGAMALWLGLMRVAEDAGLISVLARGVRPVMAKLFRDIPEGHPAMGAMVMNIAANMMGMGNAATPLGIKAMQELDKLNPRKGEATDAMCLFLAINTSSVTILPLGVMAVRAAAGARDPGGILIPTLLATCTSTLVAVTAAKILAGLYGREPVAQASASWEKRGPDEAPCEVAVAGPSGWRRWILGAYTLAFFFAVIAHWAVRGESARGLQTLSHALIPFLMGFLALYGLSRQVNVYQRLCEAGAEGFRVGVKIIPYLVAILVAVGMFRASGALELFTSIVNPFTSFLGMPPETLPVALVRPLSGSGAFAIMSEVVAKSPDSLEAFIASIMQGSTDTTFYIIAVYFGAVGVTRVRYALWAGLIGDAAGIMASVFFGRLFYSPPA
jgi:spore maturation protein SpmA